MPHPHHHICSLRLLYAALEQPVHVRAVLTVIHELSRAGLDLDVPGRRVHTSTLKGGCYLPLSTVGSRHTLLS